MKRLLSAVTALALMTGGAQALDLSAMSEDEQQAFRDQVRAYLLDNPEVILEAIDVLEKVLDLDDAESAESAWRWASCRV